MTPRQFLAFAVGKVTYQALHLIGRGGGALPGLLAENIDPSLLKWFAKQCPEGVVLVCGTNGKTTTSRLLGDTARQHFDRIIQNRSGSNLLRGHLSAFLGSPPAELAILEVDEAVLPLILQYIEPRCIVLHNLFRDQLDRYGEVNTTIHKWKKALSPLSSATTLLINGDDPNLAFLGRGLKNLSIYYYGIDDVSIDEVSTPSVVDAYLSPASNMPLHYSQRFLSHLGIYDDPASDFRRPKLDLIATKIKKGSFELKPSSGAQVEVKTLLPGLYNVYNALAAAAAAQTLGIPLSESAKTISKTEGVFGRFERLTILGKELVFCLIKNPVGATEVMRTIAEDETEYSLAFLANDRFADGRDISWYWDTAFELLADKKRPLYCAGTRSLDLALRLKYAGFLEKASVQGSVSALLDHLITLSSSKIYILCTYTATLEAQRWLTKHGHKTAYWQE